MTTQEKISKIAENKLDKLNKIVLDLYKENKCASKNQNLLIGDIIDLRTYYSAIINKDYKKAWIIQANLDTCVRESIADSCYNYIYNLSCKKK